jgi:hypothetical protein
VFSTVHCCWLDPTLATRQPDLPMVDILETGDDAPRSRVRFRSRWGEPQLRRGPTPTSTSGAWVRSRGRTPSIRRTQRVRLVLHNVGASGERRLIHVLTR